MTQCAERFERRLVEETSKLRLETTQLRGEMREGFADLFATHPSIDSRIAALVKFAGGRDPGPLALPEPGEEDETQELPQEPAVPPGGPWGGGAASVGGGKPFLPPVPPINLGGSASPAADSEPGPWGPHGKN